MKKLGTQKPKPKREKSPKLGMNFEEFVKRIIRVKPEEIRPKKA